MVGRAVDSQPSMPGAVNRDRRRTRRSLSLLPRII
jgi:hypothetical protein